MRILSTVLIAWVLGGCAPRAAARQPNAPLPPLNGRWELRTTLPPPSGGPLVVRLEESMDRNTLVGVLVHPPARALVSGRLTGRLLTLGIGPVSTPEATLSYSFDLTVGATADRATGSVAVRFEPERPPIEGLAEMSRLPE